MSDDLERRTRQHLQGNGKSKKDTSTLEDMLRKRRNETKQKQLKGPDNIDDRPPATRQYKVDTAKIADFDPGFAQALLDNPHPRQRKMQPNKVTQFARDMSSGDWMNSGDPVRVDPELRLIDGQHRCAAVVMSGITLHEVPFMMIHDPDAFLAFDQATPRKLSDQMHMAGIHITNNARHASTCMAGIIYEHLDFKPRKLTRPEQHDIISQFPEQWVTRIEDLQKQGRVTAGIAGAFIRCMRRNETEAVKFFHAFIENRPVINGQFDSNLQLLSTWFLESKHVRGKSAEGWKKECASRCIRAWNAYRKGTQLQLLRYDASQPVPDAI